MSRSSYSDEFGEDFPGQLDLFRANVRRSIRGKAGQARLRELRDALLGLPIRSLEAGTFAGGTPEAPKVCALGAWALNKQGGDPGAANSMLGVVDADDHETAVALSKHGWPRLVVLEAVYTNDDGNYGRETPEQRYARVMAWVEGEIIDERASVPVVAGLGVDDRT